MTKVFALLHVCNRYTRDSLAEYLKCSRRLIDAARMHSRRYNGHYLVPKTKKWTRNRGGKAKRGELAKCVSACINCADTCLCTFAVCKHLALSAPWALGHAAMH